MVRFLRHTADAKTWLINLTAYPQRQYLSRNILNVLGRTIQHIHNKWYGNVSKNFDFQVSCEVEALKEWLFKYYKLQSITITNNATDIWNVDFYSVEDVPPEDFQLTNIISVDDVEPNLLPFNMSGVDDEVDDNVFSVTFTIQGRLSDKQKADIQKFILLRTQKRVNFIFRNQALDDLIVFVYLKDSPNRIIDIDVIIDENNNVFVDGILETEPEIANIYNVVKISAMEIITFTGNGVAKTFSDTNPLSSEDVICQARLQSSGQIIECDITVTETTISIDTGAVAVANGTKIDILITSN